MRKFIAILLHLYLNVISETKLTSRVFLLFVNSSNSHQKKSKNHECVLRQRAKKREAYLQKLQEEGKYNPAKPTKPDPERWIPKKERSHFKGRRKNRRFGAGTSHQGISNTAGAAELEKKLDARARASGATETGASTAHISVSGSGGKKGRRGRR